VDVCVAIIARQWLGKHVPMAMNTQETIEELLDGVFCVGPCNVKYWICVEREVGT
jgi:hypothetical protein